METQRSCAACASHPSDPAPPRRVTTARLLKLREGREKAAWRSMWQPAQRPPDQFLLRTQLKCRGGRNDGQMRRRFGPQEALARQYTDFSTDSSRPGRRAWRWIRQRREFWEAEEAPGPPRESQLLIFGCFVVSSIQFSTSRRRRNVFASENKQAENILKRKWIKKRTRRTRLIRENDFSSSFSADICSNAAGTFPPFQNLPHN